MIGQSIYFSTNQNWLIPRHYHVTCNDCPIKKKSCKKFSFLSLSSLLFSQTKNANLTTAQLLEEFVVLELEFLALETAQTETKDHAPLWIKFAAVPLMELLLLNQAVAAQSLLQVEQRYL